MKISGLAMSLTGLMVLSGVTIPANNANAVTKFRAAATNPTGICQSALPVFDGVIRKRPMAVQNEGDSNAFVTCSFTATAPAAFELVIVYFSSNDGSAHQVSCTGVSGADTDPNVQYVVKDVDVPASGQAAVALWFAGNFMGAPSVFPSIYFSISCNLPPGVGINQSLASYEEDVGA